MKCAFIVIACLNICACIHAQGVTLLYKNNLGWNDPISWLQINTPAGQTPVQRIPTELDDVVVNSALSGIQTAWFIADDFNDDFYVGSNNTTGKRCRSMHISNTDLSFDYGISASSNAPTIYVYSGNGGSVIIDSGSNVHHGFFQLHGGNPAITDLQILHSTYGTLFSHAQWSGLQWFAGSKVRFISSNLGGDFFENVAGGAIYADSCTFETTYFFLGDNSNDTVLNSTIIDGANNDYLRFLIGRNSNFVSANLTVFSYSILSVTTSGSELNGDVTSLSQGGGTFDFLQQDPLNPLPNIINGNVSTSELISLGISGDLKISGNLTGFADANFFSPIDVQVNGQHVFNAGGITNLGNNNFKLEFYGDKNSNISWSDGIPVDTLIINKTGCAKVTFDSSVYVSGATKILGGQLVLNPNGNIPYKFVCTGNVDIAQGGGLFLRRDAAGVVANIAVGGTLTDHNAVADSTCAGLSNPYGGIITFYSPLPLTLLDFKGRYGGKEVTLNWSTEAEINTKYFTVEKSLDQVSFIALANITAAGNTLAHTYGYTDKSSLSSINYYRLKMADADGRFTYSRIIAVKAPANNAIVIFPNPARDKLFIRLAGITQQTAITINDAKGRCIKKLQLSAGTIQTSVNTAGLVAGVYSISFLSGTLKYARQFIKQ